jgi:hypothetical protein
MQSDKKHLLLKYPTRQRPGKFMNNLRAYMEKASGKHKITYVISMDSDDLLLNNPRIKHFLDNLPKTDMCSVLYFYGEKNGKISAINRNIPSTPWDILISTADDMEPVENGWDDIIAEDMAREFPDTNGSLNYNNDPRLEQKGADGFKTLITLPVIGRKLYEHFGYIYHPDYKSEWCDNEQTEVFEQMGVLRHINRRPIVHKWAENQDELMQHNMRVGASVDRAIYETRKANGFKSIEPKVNDGWIVQITRTRDELFLLKEMLPVWKEYADAFVFLLDSCTDGTYQYLKENANKYNIVSILKIDRDNDKLAIESDARQMLFDEAFKYSSKIICLDSDEYIDGNIKKEQLKGILEAHKDTLFYTQWIQYVGKNQIRTDGKWQVHWVDRIGSYSNRAVFKNRQMHSEHIPVPKNQLSIQVPNIFISHLQWIDKKAVAVKQYYWKIEDYVNKNRFNADVIDYTEYDKSVNNFSWQPVEFSFPLKVRSDIYKDQDLTTNYKYKFIKESVAKYSIPNLNDWGFGIH